MAARVETRMYGDVRGSFAVRVALAYLAIYVLWGSTFLAIRVAVASIPPLLAAGVRLVIAGAILYAWALARRATTLLAEFCRMCVRPVVVTSR